MFPHLFGQKSGMTFFVRVSSRAAVKNARRWLILGASALVIEVCSPPAQAQQPIPSATTEILRELTLAPPTARAEELVLVTLVTKNRDLKELESELTKIYLTLHNSGRLSVKRLTDPEGKIIGKTIEEIFRSEKLFFGKTFPPELESLACDLNSHVCKRRRDPASPEQLRSLTQHVSGFLPSRGEWELSSIVTLLLPDVHLTPVYEWFVVEKPADRPLAAVVTDELGGCVTFDDSCRDLVSFYNRSLGEKIFSDAYRGPVSLPVLTVTLQTNVATAAETRKKPDPILPNKDEETRPEKSIVLQRLPDEKSDTFKVMQQAVESDARAGQPVARGIEPVVRQLQQNVVGGIKVSKDGQALEESDFHDQRSSLTKLIAFPLATLPYPLDLQTRVHVGVFDEKVDEQHCALGGGRVSVHNLDAPASAGFAANAGASSPPCNEIVKALDTDHGTHVVGIIGALQQNNGRDVPVGLNPYAQIATIEVDLAGLTDGGKVPDLVRDLQQMLQGHQPKVVNMSFGYFIVSGTADLLGQKLAGAQFAALFVVAAGNTGSEKSYICDVRPACFELPNVISVAAVDRDEDRPHLLESDGKVLSNYGRRIHVAAVGKDVFSTISNGRFGLLSGTSQAAPQVTAVASLLASKYAAIKPIEMKNRIIYCSDLFSSLEGKLYGGRLNAECTLDGDQARLQLKAAAQVQHGQLQPSGELRFLDAENGEIVIPIANTRAVHYDPLRQKYTVFYNIEKNRKDTQLFRASSLTLQNPNEQLIFEPSEGPGAGIAVSIKVSDIKRYTSSIR